MTAGTEAFGRLDVVVNNAGYANLAAVEDITLADFRAQVEANLFGVVNVTNARVRFTAGRRKSPGYRMRGNLVSRRP